ncbi:uncharacterized protein BP5553_02969 [Venustampulla echinocandica]|uniref:GH16 domain-containing protein n=1 Tax=Venustampulla echinocandica TaxID=2656787 RepID=A0A370TSX1_9HELO|nr:uncharacterized protein BP5553_02969 [Venustampulla echinocandica]RDL38629.1 hypothetical protein BP5553_02969 [Venustampulla echinocandica]
MSLLAALFARAMAEIPNKGGYKVLWSDDFNGPAGRQADRSIWNYELASDLNGGIQEYIDEAQEASLTGDGSLIISPQKHQSGNWYSARLGSWPTFTPEDGHKMTVEAEIKLGQNTQDKQQGIWPAFWAIGTAFYKGTPWPACGEWDIMENRNGDSGILGTVHYGVNEHQSKSSDWQNNIDRTKFHKYAIDVDRTPASWKDETLTWNLDGRPYFTVKGSDVNNEGYWDSIAHQPFYMILNVAVGGGFTQTDGSKQYPNADTRPGRESGMEVNYVAVYTQ